MPSASKLQGNEFLKGDFPETKSFKSYFVTYISMGVERMYL
jgi:hypothetical protein